MVTCKYEPGQEVWYVVLDFAKNDVYIHKAKIRRIAVFLNGVSYYIRDDSVSEGEIAVTREEAVEIARKLIHIRFKELLTRLEEQQNAAEV